jgi:uncharacterized protein YndB with AHSA1/START domain
VTEEPRHSAGIVRSLQSVDGRGVVHLACRYDTGIDDLWSAITDPVRLAQWHARVDGDLRPGGTFRRYVEADGWEGTGRVEACEAPRRLVVTTRESDESWRRGQGAPPFDLHLEASLSPLGNHTMLVLDIEGLPLEPLAYFGVGWQIHMERLAAYLEGRDVGDIEARWDELIPAYQHLAAGIPQ